jgi:hypothetical protein
MKKIFALLAALLLVAGCCRTAEVRYSEEEANQISPIVSEESLDVPEEVPLPESLPPLPDDIEDLK